MKTVECLLNNWILEDKRVLVRADLNVPLKNNLIENDFRLQQVKPTLDLIRQRGGKIILMSHIGRPTKKESGLSTRHLLPWFKSQGFAATFTENLNDAHNESFKHQDSILLLENLRFFPGEKKYDPPFAQQLARLGDYYVDDAFGTLHRSDTSIALVPHFFAVDRRSIGLLVEYELSMLGKLLVEPGRPYLLMSGGGKVHDKIPLIRHLMPHLDRIMLMPATVFTFLKSRGSAVGKSIIDHTSIAECTDLMEQAGKRNVELLFPVDYQVARKSINGPLEIVSASNIPADSIGIGVGPETIALWQPEIERAKSILFNGSSGFIERAETLTGTYSLLEAMAHSNAYSVIAGGDTVAVAEKLDFDKKVTFCSTGGGATIAYLSGDVLPGLAALAESSEEINRADKN